MKRILLVAFSLCVVLAVEAARTDVLKSIRNHYKEILVPTDNPNDNLDQGRKQVLPDSGVSDSTTKDVYERQPLDADAIMRSVRSLNADGSWNDIDYESQTRSNWSPSYHTARVLEMAKLLNCKDSEYYQSKELAEGIHKALDCWFKKALVCPNWWHNQIGTPYNLGRAFMLLDGILTKDEVKEAVKVMEQAKFGMTGQNKVWLAGNVLMRAILLNDVALARQARDEIASEIVLGRKEGIKPDWSFHQHGAQQQFGNYGLSFVSSIALYAYLFKGTEFAFSDEQMDIMRNLVDKGYRWIVWHRMFDINSLGRQFYRQAPLYKAYNIATASRDLGFDFTFPTDRNDLVGHKHFDYSDMSVHRTKDWMFTVKMSSNRCLGAEYVNEDNRLGYYLGDGGTYYYVSGQEYYKVFPFWDWRKVPGVTVIDGEGLVPDLRETKSNNQSDLVGGLELNGNGLTAMELNRDGMKAYKVWISTDKFVASIGGGIQADSENCVTTSVEQRQKNHVLLEQLDGNGRWTPIYDNAKHFNIGGDQQTYWHDGTGYVVGGNNFVYAGTEYRTGSWSDNMGGYREPELLKGEVMYIYMNHGPLNRVPGSYQYAVLPNASKADVAKFDLKKEVEVLLNTSEAQVFYVPSTGKGCWVVSYGGKSVDFRMPVTLGESAQGGRPQMQRTTFAAQAPGLYYIELDGKDWKVVAKKEFELTK